MKNEKISFVFFGSGPVAAENLRQLREHFLVEVIITKPTTEQEMRAVCPDTPLYCVSNKHELDTLMGTKVFKSDVGVLIDFGIIVSQKVIDTFEKGIVNSHFSLLPQWRGADPITYSILSGQKQTGVSLMLLVEQMDEGPIISVGIYDMKGTETTPILTDGLIALSTGLLRDALPLYLKGSIKPLSQSEFALSLGYSESPTYSRKLTKDDGIIDWSKPAVDIEREVRAYAGWPKSRTIFRGVEIVITAVTVIESMIVHENTGSLHLSTQKELLVTCGTGSIRIDTLKPAGKKEMNAQSFLAGYKSRLGL